MGEKSYLFHAPNYRMTELVGAVGLAQLEKLPAYRKAARTGRTLHELLSRVDGLEPAAVTPGAKHSYWQYPICVGSVSSQAVAAEIVRQRIGGGRIHRQADYSVRSR